MHNPKLQHEKNYKLFLMNEENRPIDPDAYHYRKLRTSMQRYGFLPAYPLHCRPRNGRLEIFDGHRRFSVAKELGLPVWFVVYDDGQLDLPFINETQEKWNLSDYVGSRAQQGRSDYVELQEFSKTNEIPLSIAAALLAGCAGVAGITLMRIRSGDFEIKDRDIAQRVASVYRSIKSISRITRHAGFVNALTRCMRVKGFNASRLIENARKCPGKLVTQPDIQGFLRMLEEIYNFQSRAPIPLAFLANEMSKDKVIPNKRKPA